MWPTGSSLVVYKEGISRIIPMHRNPLRRRPFRHAITALLILLTFVSVSLIHKKWNVKSDKENIWGDYRVSQLWSHLDCDKIFLKERPVHSKETWRQLREMYEAVVSPSSSSIGNLSAGLNGFGAIGHYGKQSPGMGRGIFASEFVPEGTLIYDFGQTAQFKDGQSYREFIMHIENDLACDVLQWAYVFDLNEGKGDEPDLRINVDLDDGSFCNGGSSSEGNLGYLPVENETRPRKNGMRPLFATQDIKEGDEILCKYGEFSEGDWVYFGL